MERLDNLISEIHSQFDTNWLDNAKQLFSNHPSIKGSEANHEFTIIDDETGTSTQRSVGLFDFLSGIKDDRFDDWHDEQEMDEKLEGVYENEVTLIQGAEYTSSNQFYPQRTYKECKTKILDLLKMSVLSVSAHNDKTKIISYARRLLTDQIKSLDKSEIAKLNNQFINSIINEIDNSYGFLEEVEEILNDGQDFLDFNIDTAKLARLYQFLSKKEILLSDKMSFLNFAGKYCRVTKNGEKVRPNKSSLDTKIKELNSTPEIFEAWLKKQDFDLKP